MNIGFTHAEAAAAYRQHLNWLRERPWTPRGDAVEIATLRAVHALEELAAACKMPGGPPCDTIVLRPGSPAAETIRI
jgi:hypothetical protein